MSLKIKLLFLFLIISGFFVYYGLTAKTTSNKDQSEKNLNNIINENTTKDHLLVREGIGPGFFKENGEVFFYYRENNFKIEGADADSFETLKDSFAKDKNHIFFTYHTLINADLDSFQALDYGYSKDNKQVFFNEKTLKDVDAQTFVVLSHVYTKDKNKIFYDGRPIAVDINSYEIIRDEIGSSYIKDNKNVYFNDELMLYADPASFQVLADGYAKDKHSVYLSGLTMLDTFLGNEYIVDADSFVVLGNGYTKDKLHVFRWGKILPGVNPDTFLDNK